MLTPSAASRHGDRAAINLVGWMVIEELPVQYIESTAVICLK